MLICKWAHVSEQPWFWISASRSFFSTGISATKKKLSLKPNHPEMNPSITNSKAEQNSAWLSDENLKDKILLCGNKSHDVRYQWHNQISKNNDSQYYSKDRSKIKRNKYFIQQRSTGAKITWKTCVMVWQQSYNLPFQVNAALF